MDKILGLASFVLAMSQVACLSTLLGSGDSKSQSYHFPNPGPGWETIDPAEADAAYRNSVDHSILNISSTCGEDRFRSLEDLSNDVWKQLPDREPLAPAKSIQVAGNPGLLSEVKGKVDGRDLKVRLAVVRTSECVFDIMLAGPSLDQSSRVAFDQVLGGFQDNKR